MGLRKGGLVVAHCCVRYANVTVLNPPAEIDAGCCKLSSPAAQVAEFAAVKKIIFLSN